MSDKPVQPIIKKIKKVTGHGHHGGAWKIAYADFVTAMMAFFLLMWLLNATSEEQRRGIANYFDPFASTSKGGGYDGVMGGTSIKESTGAMDDTPLSTIKIKPMPPTERGKGGDAAGETVTPDVNANDNGGRTEDIKKREEDSAKKDIENKLIKASQVQAYKSQQEEESKLNEVSEQIKQSIEKMPDLKELNKNIKISLTKDGLNIEIIDHLRNAMFPSGSSRMYKQMEDILKVIATAIKEVPNKLNIIGHTDANQYSQRSLLTNWELSTDRANASRRILVNNGVDKNRINAIEGKADTDLADPQNPMAPENRRVVIALLRQVKVNKE